MSAKRRLIILFMLPVWIFVIPALLLLVISANLFQDQVVQGHRLSAADLEELQAAAAFGVRFADSHQEGIQLLEAARNDDMTSLEAFRAHTALVEKLNDLKTELQQIAGTELLQAVNAGSAQSLLDEFTQYHRQMIMATEIAVVDPSTAEVRLALAQQNFARFVRFNQRISELLTERSSLRLDQAAEATVTFIRQLGIVAVVATALLLLLAWVMAGWLHRRFLVITDALSRLARSTGPSNRLEAVEQLAAARGSAFQSMAQAILKLQASDQARIKAEAQADRLQRFDTLTGLPNWQMMSQHLAAAQLECKQNRATGMLLTLDLDEFKTINDVNGHSAGDSLLQECARRLQDLSLKNGHWGRLGGDEFALVIAPLAGQPLTRATELLQQVMDTIRRPFEINGTNHHITPSIGAILFNSDQPSPETLFQFADTALHRAKQSGRNTWYFHNNALQQEVENRLQTESELRQALRDQAFELYYQSQVDTSGRIVGVEGLLRWQHPERGTVAPGAFISVAEESGLIIPLGHWVLQQACKQLATWAEEPYREALTIAVNVSASQFQHPEFIDTLRQVLRDTGANPNRLKLEITESTLLGDMNDTVAVMHELKALGVTLSLDDFGTGYSSLQYLKRLPISQIKIDQSFVQDINHDPEDRAIVQTIIAMGEALQIQVIAEGVETREHWDSLRRFGCPLFQGYHFCRPQPIAQLELNGLSTRSL